jgi:N-acetylmuramoyl-L-alanine amidase
MRLRSSLAATGWVNTTCLGVVLCVGLLGQEAAAPLGAIREIKISAQDDLTRVTVVAEGVIDIKADRADNPARIFFDFAGMKPRLEGVVAKGGIRTIEASGKLLKQVRVAENQKGVTRLVFDLTVANGSEVEYRSMVMSGPNRLVVELKPKAGVWKNPLAPPVSAIPANPAPPPSRSIMPVVTATVSAPSAPAGKVIPRKFVPDPQVGRRVTKSNFKLPEPPVLVGEVRLPKAEPSALPYRLAGFAYRDFRVKLPPSNISRRAEQTSTPAVAATRMAGKQQSLTRVLGLKIGKVVIDPGHGGHDAGSIGTTGLVEKEVTLDVAKRLAELIEANLGSEVVLTRTDDTYISPEARTLIANSQKADLFISVHANSSRLNTASGVETYYLNFTSSAEALEVAARENASSERSVGDLQDLIKKIALKDKIDESREFATRVQQTLYAGSVKAGNRTKDRGVRKAPFIVLIGAGMPCILTEIGFLSNPKEEALLKKPEYRQKIAEALYKGVAQYANTLSHFNVAQVGASGGND